MRAGTKNLLFGEHQIIIHSLFVALAWWRLFGFPKDLRIWVCFFIHDLGYWGKDDIDGKDGKAHPELGASIVHWLFDKKGESAWWAVYPPKWYEFCLYHSRHCAKKAEQPVSALALADKYAFVITPWWVFLPLAKLSGGLKEYLEIYRHIGASNLREWHERAREEAWNWVDRTLDQPVPGCSGYYTSWEKRD